MTSNAYAPSSAPLILAHATSKPRSLKKRQKASASMKHTMGAILSSNEWARLHLALGHCPLQAEQWFAHTDTLLRERYQMALIQQITPGCFDDYPLLHDPIEDDPQWRDAFEETEGMLAFELELAEVSDGPGHCLFVWQTKAHILREEFGLEWFSPAQMNPFRRFA